MLIYPNDFAETSLQIFKKLAIILDDASFRQEVLSQNSAHGIYDVLCRYENRLGD
jgi:mannitol/fructose-specific phosphotransferase system IIA component (Ntr-type)